MTVLGQRMLEDPNFGGTLSELRAYSWLFVSLRSTTGGPPMRFRRRRSDGTSSTSPTSRSLPDHDATPAVTRWSSTMHDHRSCRSRGGGKWGGRVRIGPPGVSSPHARTQGSARR
jgi:hypothetical protein